MDNTNIRKMITRILLFALGVGMAVLLLPLLRVVSSKPASLMATTPTTLPQTVPAGREVATLAGGCFWALQTEFKQLQGVESVVVGYTGGTVPQPTYEQVCDGTTGHAEAINLVYDPKVISYTELLRIFLTAIDPTTLNRQGADEGTQYRSAIFYRNAAQKADAEKVIAEMTTEKIYSNPIVTEVTAYTEFYPAEEYHQDYCPRNPFQPYCAGVVAKKIAHFQKMNRDRLKK